jgi:hypothetical protein
MATVTGGAKLADKLRDMARLMSNASSVKVGFLAEAKYPDGTPVAMIAAIQDYGAPSVGIPPRPFFRNMVAARKGEWPDAIRALLKANGYDALRTLQQTGEAIAGQLRQSIIDTNEPPLAESTIRRKGFDKPLVDTGHMWQSVDYEVNAT